MFKINLKLKENEIIEISRPANHFLRFEGVGGRIFITNLRFVFKSHAVNFQAHELTINYSEIKSVVFYNTLAIVPNGLKIILHSGKIEKFAVWKRSLIKKAIYSYILATKKMYGTN